MKILAISVVIYTFLANISCTNIQSVVRWDNALHSRPRRDLTKTILEEPDCVELRRYCTGLSENSDLLVLECMHSFDQNVLARVSDKCQHVLWNHTRSMIDNENVKNLLFPVCREDLERSVKCNIDDPEHGSYLKCLVSNKDDIVAQDCNDMLMRVEGIAFSDYRWISSFLKSCDRDIDAKKCGRIDHDRISQSQTIACLHDQISEINEQCRKEVFKLSQVQADNIRLDQQLYVACVDDQIRYCSQFAAGSGRVFKCLQQHRNEKLTEKCKNQLLRREKLISHDYRISKGLMRACKEDIKAYHCRRQASDDKDIRLAQVLLCLENVMKNGTKIEAGCEAEMVDHRKILMEDYRLSPEIVKECSGEIKQFCTQLEIGGKTIHCLMEHARLKNAKPKKRIGATCQRALEALVKQSDAGEDWRVDPVLHAACNPVVQAVCRDIRGGDARVMSCLLDQIGADHMTDECEDALIQIQYFVARDFRLDPQLYRACREDAGRLCHAGREWEEHGIGMDGGPLVLPCLYRYAYHSEEEMKLRPICLEQIRRVMRQRAVSVDLHPDLETQCLDDLGLYCFRRTAKGQETLCLQDNLDKLTDQCKKAVEELTEVEAEYVELNPYITANCHKVIQTFCADESKRDEGDIMECLVHHKNHPVVKMSNSKCRVSIEHFQLISLKDYRFTYKFKIACKPYAVRFCHAAKTKSEVVGCLSEKITNDTLAGVKSDIPKECRQQLKSQLFQQRENIDFDPKLANSCQEDIRAHCRGIEHGSSQVLECLQTLPEKKLTEKCQIELFKVKKQETSDNSVDYALMTMCADAIDEFCPHVESSKVLECLKHNRDSKGFSPQCHTIVTHRIIEQNSDYRLNPNLHAHCKPDIKKFCFKVAVQVKPERELNGDVIKCLRGAFRQSRLTRLCEQEMAEIIKAQALDVQLNPLLRVVCQHELETVCKKEDGNEDGGHVEECLKTALLEKKLQTPACMEEVANMIEESQADINVDPVLQNACVIDLLKYCGEIEQGSGRQIRCLKVILDDSTKQLTTECKSMFTKRLVMYKNAAEVAPDGLQQLYVQVAASPSKQYFFLVFMMMVFSIFVIGIFCGRVTRRHILLKNK